jgi:hypothetical protein
MLALVVTHRKGDTNSSSPHREQATRRPTDTLLTEVTARRCWICAQGQQGQCGHTYVLGVWDGKGRW